MVASFSLDHLGMEVLLNSPEFAAELEKRAQAIATRAEEIAPYSDRDTSEEHYRDSITSGVFMDHWTGPFGDESRVTGFVQANVPWACTVEVQHRTLGTALGAAGGAE